MGVQLVAVNNYLFDSNLITYVHRDLKNNIKSLLSGIELSKAAS